jgi:hypothetical protein
LRSTSSCSFWGMQVIALAAIRSCLRLMIGSMHSFPLTHDDESPRTSPNTDKHWTCDE